MEPINYDDTDSEKRLKFYSREGFRHARAIGYNRKSLATDEETPMEILYWSPRGDSEEIIYSQMKKMYEDIHTYKDKEIYGKKYQPSEEVLRYNEDEKSDNLLEGMQKRKESN